ncbi:MAG: hypothetical protein FWG66_07545 [Spirochaetes bacterium]|nr:hypothetical protein [Spirochaetota bacterium]
MKNVLNVMLIAFVLLGFFNYFFDVQPLLIVVAVIQVTVLLFTIPKLSKITKLVMAMMFIFGASLLIHTGAEPWEWLLAIIQNRNLLLLLICAPMISLPFYYQDYQGELKTLTQVKMRNVMSFLLMVAIFTHFISVLISIGGILIAYTMMKPLATQYNADRIFLKTLTRNHFSSGFWSPAWATVIIFSTFPDVSWLRIIPVALVFVVIFNAMNFFDIYREVRRDPQKFQPAEPPAGTKADKNKLYTMLILALAMVAAIVALNVFTDWELTLIVPIVSLLFPLAAALIQKFPVPYIAGVKNYYNDSLVKVREQVALFTLAGFLARALDISGAGLAMANLLPAWLHGTPPAMIAAIILIMTLPPLIGIHPNTVGITMVIVLQPAALGLTNYTFALAMIMGWIMGLMLTPFSAAIMIVSSLNGKSTFENSLFLNWKFGAICIVVFSLLISIAGPMLG